MMLRMRKSFAIVLTMALISASLPAVAAPATVDEKRLITEKDIFQFNWTANPQISPDGSQVVFVKVSVNEKKDGYDTALWAVSTQANEPPHRLTNWFATRLQRLYDVSNAA